MILLLAPIILAVVVVIDLLLAWITMVIGPYTGLPFLQTLDYWNWFFIVVLAQVLTVSSSSASSAKK